VITKSLRDQEEPQISRDCMGKELRGEGTVNRHTKLLGFQSLLESLGDVSSTVSIQKVGHNSDERKMRNNLESLGGEGKKCYLVKWKDETRASKSRSFFAEGEKNPLQRACNKIICSHG